MKKIILLVILAVAIIFVGGFWLTKLNSQNKISIFGSSMEALAKESIVVEVISGQVLISLGGQEKVLEAPLNQEIDKDAVLTTAAGSQANIIFPSGSIARLDESSSVSLADFSNSDSSIFIKLKLEAGNLWSRVQRLADKETDYEVETSNTVAVVKGTSFNMSFSEGKTKLEVFSNKVALKAIDPQTRQLIVGAEAEVAAGSFAETDQAMPPAPQKPLEVKAMAAPDLEKPWLKGNLEKDKKIDDIVFKNTGAGNALITKAILKQSVLPEIITIKKEVLGKNNILLNKMDAAKQSNLPQFSLPPKVVAPVSSVSASPGPVINKITPRPTVPLPTKASKPNTGTVSATKLGIASITPNSAPGPSYQYTKVTIKGSGFTAQTKAMVGSYSLESIKIISANVLEGIVPAKIQPGQYDVILTDSAQKASLPGGFNVVQAKE